MSKQLTYFLRAARSVTALSLCMAGAALPGCFTVEEAEPECSKNSDCDDNEICTDDDECESACRGLCQTMIRCGTSSLDQASCEDGCESARDALNDSNCDDSIVALASCFDDNSNCADADSECAAERSAFSTYCVVEEPECSDNSGCDADEICTVDQECQRACGAVCETLVRCGSGMTDQVSCEDSCELVRVAVNDSNCDSSVVALGSCFDDNSNCADANSQCGEEASAFSTYCTVACPFTDDGECDEPDICPAGSDVNDCAASGG